jgi:hypothetical protein
VFKVIIGVQRVRRRVCGPRRHRRLRHRSPHGGQQHDEETTTQAATRRDLMETSRSLEGLTWRAVLYRLDGLLLRVDFVPRALRLDSRYIC